VTPESRVQGNRARELGANLADPDRDILAPRKPNRPERLHRTVMLPANLCTCPRIRALLHLLIRIRSIAAAAAPRPTPHHTTPHHNTPRRPTRRYAQWPRGSTYFVLAGKLLALGHRQCRVTSRLGKAYNYDHLRIKAKLIPTLLRPGQAALVKLDIPAFSYPSELPGLRYYV
jgi:hypothetical protein